MGPDSPDSSEASDVPNTSGNAYVLAGLGGIGKSSLADRHARRHAASGALVWWITAENAERLAAGLAALAHSLLAETTLVPDPAAAQWARAWLATHDDWLLVLDDVSALDDIADLCGSLPRGRFLITTRRTTGWGPIAESTRLDVLSPDQSLTVLTGFAGSALTADGGPELCQDLGHLPLALRQAGAYLEQNQVSAAVYRERLTGGVLGWTADGADPRETIARVWQVSLDRITEDHGPLPGRILRVLSWLAPDAIPLDLLAWDGLGQQEVDEAVGRLGAYSLVSRNGTDVSVHRLVQLVGRTASARGESGDGADDVGGEVGTRETATRETVTRESATREAARRAATALRGTAPLLTSVDFEHWPNLRRQLPHAHALVAATTPADDNRAAAELYSIIGSFHLLQGAGTESTTYLRRALIFVETDTADNPEYHAEHTRISLALAQAHMQSGNVVDAIALLEATVARAEPNLGSEHRDVLAVQTALGTAYIEMGRNEDATRALTAAVETNRKNLGENNPTTWGSVRSLARLLSATGQAAEAITLLEPIHQLSHDQFGPGHAYTVMILQSLADAHSKAGDHERAAALLEEASALSAESMGSDSIRTLTAQNDLGIAHMRAGRWDEAIQTFEANLPVLERVEVEDASAFRMRVNLAVAYSGRERHADAIPVLRDAIDRVDHRDDFDPLNLTAARTALATAHLRTGEPGPAVELFRRCLADSTRLRSADDPETIATRVLLASALTGVGDARAPPRNGNAASPTATGPCRSTARCWPPP
ncbi:tetratricopeptide repeat protein [Catenulispora yoronensis]